MYTRNTLTLLSVFSVALAQDTSAPLALAVLPAASLNLLPDMGTSMPMLSSASATTIMPISMAVSMTSSMPMSNSMPTSMPTSMSTMPSVTMPMDPTVTSMSSMVTSMMVGTGGGGVMTSMGPGGNMSMTLPTLKGSSTMSGSAKASGTGPSVASNGGQEVGSSIKKVMIMLAGVAGLFVWA